MIIYADSFLGNTASFRKSLTRTMVAYNKYENSNSFLQIMTAWANPSSGRSSDPLMGQWREMVFLA
jgi:hypothetical protein